MQNCRIAAMLLGSAILAACAGSQISGPLSTSYVVSSPSAQFYKYGPAQALGADFTLGMGQRVTMLSREFGYSHVMMENGVSGYVATEDLKPAPPATPTPKPVSAPQSSLFSGRAKNPPPSKFKPSPEPLFDVSDVLPAPLPKDPEKPESKPTFRY